MIRIRTPANRDANGPRLVVIFIDSFQRLDAQVRSGAGSVNPAHGGDLVGKTPKIWIASFTKDHATARVIHVGADFPLP